MIEFSSVYSFWWMLPILLISAALSALLYFRNSKEEFSSWLSFLLAFFRFTVFSVLGFLLLSPLVISWKTDVDKAKILIVSDNTKSMILYGDTAKLRANNNDIIQGLSNSLNEKYDVVNYSFGNSVRKSSSKNNFSEYRTDISKVFDDLQAKYKYSNIGAMILLSDGILNMGNNPEYNAKDSHFPIYTLGFGDTNVYHDIAITKVLHNNTVFIKNKFPIEVNILAKKLAGKSSQIIIKSAGRTIATKSISFSSEKELQKHKFIIEEKSAGIKSYSIYVKVVDDEINTINNFKKINVEVLGQKKKLLLVYESPNPDIAALQQIIRKTEEYKLDVLQFGKATFKPKDYSLIVLHQLPNSASRSLPMVNDIKDANIPILMILGGKSSINSFNALNFGLQIANSKNSFVEATAIANPQFSDFIIEPDLKDLVSSFPPLQTAYGRYKIPNSFHTIFYQQIGSVATKYPLIAVSELSGSRNAFVFGEGFWRWRMYDYFENASTDLVDDLFLKIIRYISLSKEHQRFEVQWKTRYLEYENIDFSAIFLNASYEPIMDAEISIIITNEEGKSFPYVFSVTDDNYVLNASKFPVGTYSFIAKAEYSEETFIKKGNFGIEQVEIEALDLLANHSLLKRISANSKGEFYLANKYNDLADVLLNKEDIVDIESQSLQYKDLVKFPFIFFLVLLLLSIEWFLRKQMGSY